MMKLEDKSDMPVSETRQFFFLQVVNRVPLIFTDPPVDFSRVPMIWRKVVLPAPLAPTMVTISPFADRNTDAF